jgi:2'-5' RNA ligase
MSRRSRQQLKNSPKSWPATAQHEELQRLVEAEVSRRLSQMALPPGAKPRPLNQDALLAQMQTQQSPEKHGTPMFSPGAPLIPSPGLVNPGGPRGYQFNVGYNIQSQPRSSEETSFSTLRNLAALYDGIQLCEQVWLDTVAKLTLKIKPRAEIIAEQGQSVASSKYNDKIRKYTDFFSYPDRDNGYDLKSWLRAAVRDQLQLDAVAIYVRRNRGGGVYSLELTDGSSIKPLIDARGRRPQPPYPAFQQFLYGVPAGLYTSDEMLYQRETTRTESIYGLSRVERILLRINQALRKENKDLSRFTDGNIPPGILTPPDDGSQWTPEQLMVYQEMWDALLAGNDQARSRIKVIQPGSQITPLQDQDIFVDFDRFLLNVTAACYSMTMADLGFTENVNKSSGDSQENVFYRRAVQPIMDRYATLFTYILRYYFGEQDLIVSWSGFEESEDFNAMAASYALLTERGIVSPTTAAHQMNLPWSGPEIPNFVMTKDGPVFLEDLADPAMRNAANDAKLAGYGMTSKPLDNDAQAANGDETPRESGEKGDALPLGSVEKDNVSTPPGLGANRPEKGNESNNTVSRQLRAKDNASPTTPPSSGNKEHASKAVIRGDDGDDLRPEVITEYTGMMIAFMIKPEIAEQLAVPDGEPAEAMHCTLAYLGDMNDGDIDNAWRERLRILLASFADTAPSLYGKVGGLARFTPSESSDEASPVIALVNCPGLQEWRRSLVETLESAGYHIANDFDYMPHITLAYIDPDAPMPLDDAPALPLAFDEICFAIGEDRYLFPLSEDATPSRSVEDDERNDLPDVFRADHDAWRPPSEEQLSLEAALAQAIKDFIDQAQITTDGVVPPDETEQTQLLESITDLLTDAIHEGRRIATGLEERGLVSAVKNLAGRAVSVVGSIIEQLKEKVQAIIEVVVSGSAVKDADASTKEVKEQLDTWAKEYSAMVAETEIHAAVEEAIVDELGKQGVTEIYWVNDGEPCVICIGNANASPLPPGATWPSGNTTPPAHPRCKCTTRPGKKTAPIGISS